MVNTATSNVWRDEVNNQGAFKINVMGNVGDKTKVYLLNLDDITPIQLPNGQTAYLIWSLHLSYIKIVNLTYLIHILFFLSLSIPETYKGIYILDKPNVFIMDLLIFL